jgi:hypothetical protein
MKTKLKINEENGELTLQINNIRLKLTSEQYDEFLALTKNIINENLAKKEEEVHEEVKPKKSKTRYDIDNDYLFNLFATHREKNYNDRNVVKYVIDKAEEHFKVVPRKILLQRFHDWKRQTGLSKGDSLNKYIADHDFRVDEDDLDDVCKMYKVSPDKVKKTVYNIRTKLNIQ